MYEQIKYDVTDPLATITLNRPDRLNAQGAAMRQELQSALTDFAHDAEMRVGIVTGAGRAFSAGADLKEMAEGQSEARALQSEEERIESFRGNQLRLTNVFITSIR